MDSSTSFSQKLSIQKEKISNSKTNAVIRTRFDKAVDEINKGGLLNGKTFLIKDNIAIKSEPLSCASKILKSYISPFNATAVERIQKAGGLITGQTNCDEFAMGSSSEFSIYGAVKNPFNLDLVAGGSSGGSAAAIAEGLSDIALGSDTGGSIRQPASFCGVLGFKPTYGRVSRWGLIAYASSFDQIGPFSNNVEDTALIMEVIAGSDQYDSTVSSLDVPNFSAELNQPIKKLKIAYLKDCLDNPSIDKEVKEQMLQSIEKLKELGHELKAVELSLIHI